MTAIRRLVSEQISALEARVKLSNKQGDVDGLFAQFVLDGTRVRESEWQVNCAEESWIRDHESGLALGNPNFLAALGYSLAELNKEEHDSYFAVFIRGIKRLQERDLFPADGVSFPNMPRVFLGLVMGVKAIPDTSTRYTMNNWLADILNQTLVRRPATAPWGLLYRCVRSLLANEPERIDVRSLRDVTEMALFDFGLRRRIFEPLDLHKESSAFTERVLEEALKVDAQQLDSGHAAILCGALHRCLTASVHELMVSPSHVSLLLSRFQDAMKRWRWDEDHLHDPIRWPIRNEREIQDIVWLILRPVFLDLVDEDTLPRFGHSSYKADFGIPQLGLLIEVKMARKAEDFKNIEKEIMVDSRGYLVQTNRYNKLLVFVYDQSASVQEHGTTIQALKQLPEIEDVIIVSRPSHLPQN
ncbi:MAG: hypothetical protein HYX88_04575 [Chloroflexi bacterium]|nr:hypothetical protein [Chloroflexota bacterium]